MVDFIGGEYVGGRVGAELEVVRLEFVQLLVVELGLVDVVPGAVEHLVGGREAALLAAAQTAAAEGVGSLDLVGLALLRVVVLVVDRPVVLRGAAQVEVSRSLVHCCYIYYSEEWGEGRMGRREGGCMGCIDWRAGCVNG
jgi:hypothetical protein